jgi:hypothetical protein
MGKRPPSNFRKSDVLRAVASARDAGVPVAGVEITCKDGTVIKVLGDNAPEVQAAHASAAAVKAWDEATEKLKSEKPQTEKTKTKKRR